ncbi:MAG: hypothetical protein U0229_11115 [Anaeromyxobacter sp.]
METPRYLTVACAITIDPVTGAVGEHPKGDALAAWPVRRPR